MMKRLEIFYVLLIILSGCADSQQSGTSGKVTLPEIDISGSPNGIVSLPENTPELFTDWFSKYTKVIAPNGKPIHMLAQSGWTNGQVVKARNVLEHILTDFPGSEYGNDKALVANSLSDRKATMVLFDTPDDLRSAMRGPLGSDTDLSMQDLRANECPVEGTEDYMAHRTRDASYEEILHLVQDYGIKPALPDFQKEIEAAHNAMTEKDLWHSWGDANEYIAVIYDNYLDLWTVNPTVYEGRPIEQGEISEGGTHFGAYRAANGRSMLKTNDSQGYELIEKFFPPYLTYTPELPEDFEGIFSIELDASKRYTYKSQHLRNVTLTGNNDADLTGNGYDNVLTGNNGKNSIKGGSGDDQIDGGDSVDTAVYSGAYSEYTVSNDAGTVTIHDTASGRDGTDILKNIEALQFRDRKVDI
jgi:hypothetical protein